MTSDLQLNHIVYGIIFPSILAIGFLGAIANLTVLCCNKSFLKGYHYTYIKGMTVCDLLVVIFSIPFTLRMCNQRTQWDSKVVAWYYAHLELYTINTCCGTGVLLTVATTTERYLGFCHPFKARNLHLRHPNHPRYITCLAMLIAAILYLPFVIHSSVQFEVSFDNNTNTTQIIYEVVENKQVTTTLAYNIFSYFKEVMLRIIPAVALGLMNARIIHSYRRASHYLHRKLTMRMQVMADDVSKLRRDRRLIIVLVGITLQFIICTMPAAVLAMTLDAQQNSNSYTYEIFRSIANLLEITKNSSSFFVYCLCSVEYRQYTRACFTKCSPKRKSHVKHIFDNMASV